MIPVLVLRPSFVSVLLVAVWLSTATPAAAEFLQTHKLNGDDVQAFDQFGNAVGISGQTAVVGAALHDGAKEDSDFGAVYVFDVATGQQLHKLTATDPTDGDGFGQAVAVSGKRLVVGVPQEDGTGRDSGAVYVYDTVTGQRVGTLIADDARAFARFGFSVGISGNTAIVSARADQAPGVLSGAAYLFDVTTGRQLHKLTNGSATPKDDLFGFAAAVGGNAAIVGAHFDDDLGSNAGAAYVYETATGRLMHKLTSDDGGANDFFGAAVAVDGGLAVVGAYLDDDGGQDAGAVYVFDVATGQQLFKLTAGDANAADRFGWSVGINGNIAIVGAIGDDERGDFSGAAYFFDLTTGQQLAKLKARDAANGDAFGNAVAITGGTAIIGALTDGNGLEIGSAYLFDVPEPGTAGLLAVGGLFAMQTRRRR